MTKMKIQDENYIQKNNQSNEKRAGANTPSGLFFALLTFSLIGIADAAYLTYTAFAKKAVNCSVLEGCNVVLSSQYATLGPVPLAFIGVLFYFSVFALSVAYLTTRKRMYLIALLGITTSGLVVSLVLVYLQVGVINALCQYCLVSAALSLLLFAGSVLAHMYTSNHSFLP